MVAGLCLDTCGSEELTTSLSSPFYQGTIQVAMVQRAKALEKYNHVPEFGYGALGKLYKCFISSSVNWS